MCQEISIPPSTNESQLISTLNLYGESDRHPNTEKQAKRGKEKILSSILLKIIGVCGSWYLLRMYSSFFVQLVLECTEGYVLFHIFSSRQLFLASPPTNLSTPSPPPLKRSAHCFFFCEVNKFSFALPPTRTYYSSYLGRPLNPCPTQVSPQQSQTRQLFLSLRFSFVLFFGAFHRPFPPHCPYLQARRLSSPPPLPPTRFSRLKLLALLRAFRLSVISKEYKDENEKK